MSREIDIKLCRNYKKIHIYSILYKSSRFKQIIFNKYAKNLKTIISYRSLRISGLLQLKFLNFYFAFLIDNNIITYSPYYVIRTLANGSAVYWSRDTGGNHMTSNKLRHSPFKELNITKPKDKKPRIIFAIF